MSNPWMRPVASGGDGRSRMAAVWQRLSQYWAVIRIERVPRQLRVRETLQIGEKRQLLVVEVGERQLLIGAAGNCLTMLAELEGPSKAEADGYA